MKQTLFIYLLCSSTFCFICIAHLAFLFFSTFYLFFSDLLCVFCYVFLLQNNGITNFAVNEVRSCKYGCILQRRRTTAEIELAWYTFVVQRIAQRWHSFSVSLILFFCFIIFCVAPSFACFLITSAKG